MSDMELIELQLSSEKVFDGVLLKVYRDKVRLPNGNETTRELIKHQGAVCVVPVTDDGNVIVERQFRYPVGRVITEVPAGKLDGPDEDHLEAAKRELREETGLTADHWTEMGTYLAAAAYTSECITMYLATGLHWGERQLDDDEFLDVMEVPFDELINDIMSGSVSDGKTISSVLKAARILGK